MMVNKLLAPAAASLLLLAGTANAGDAESCKTVRFSDVGWSCITATTSIASTMLQALGYEPKATILSVPVTFESLKNNDIDAFLGLWLPTQESMINPYFEAATIDNLSTNLEGAKYTLAVPQYVYDGGVKNFADLAKFKDKFGSKIYGIEPGNDGNTIILDMIDKNAFDLGGWQLVESSEAGMLSQVERAMRGNEWIVFLGWEPHPMNKRFEMAYLGGDETFFGPNYGGSTVYTLARKGYETECPNAARLLKQMTFSLELENAIMGWMLDEGLEPQAAAEKLLKENPDLIDKWTAGVTTIDGKSEAAPVVKQALGM